MSEAYLSHHGIKGQKWGVRRYQNEDGSRTQIGKRHRDDVGQTGRKNTAKKIAKGIGVAVGVAAIAYGAYKLSQIPAVKNRFTIDSVIQSNASVSSSIKNSSTKKGRNIVDSILNGTETTPNPTKVSSKLKVKTTPSDKPPDGFTFRRHLRVDASGKTSHIDLPTDPKRYADDFAKKMSNGNQKDYDYWHRYITNRMKYQ